MSGSTRWSFRFLETCCAALIGALAIPACGGSPGTSDQSFAATTTSVAAARDDGRGEGKDDGDDSSIAIKTLSNRADLISGGDALVELVLSNPRSLAALRVELNGHDVKPAFARRSSGRVLGVVTGLVDGENVLVARAGNSKKATRLTITNHPIGGPVIAGQQQLPFVCATPTPQPATLASPATNASGLHTEAIDAQCNIATEFHLFYRTTAAGCVNVLPDPSPPAVAPANTCFKPFTPGPAPADLALTTTDLGITVPYIVRVERGTIDRGIYDIAVLFDPDHDWKPWAPQPAWNGKVVHSFGASTGQPRRQFRSEQSWVDDSALSRGFMVVDNSMTDSLFNSNRVYNAEALMMTKEHIVDTYGEIRYTMGNGCSGGSIQQLTAASIFPGLLDGVQPSCTYPDSETTGMEVSDCVLLVNYFNSTTFANLTAGLTRAQIDARKAAIAGHLDPSACWGWNNTFGANNKPGQFVPNLVINTTGLAVPLGAPRNNCQLLASQVYDPIANLLGPRCGSWDNSLSIWGAVPQARNQARSTADNTGIQYGLGALSSGTISAEEFVALNEKVGGFDADTNPSPSRSVADPEALRIAYATGIVSAGQLAKTPIIDLRGFDERTPNFGAGPLFGIHLIWRSYAVRARLDQANGNHGNHVFWRFGNQLTAPAASGLTLQSFLTMDQWLANIEKDSSGRSREEKVVADKPAAAVDFCFLPSDTTFATKITDFAICDADPGLVRHASPRQVAGGPVAENILKCQLKPLDFADPAYGGATFTPDQQNRLRAVFPAGVCDWTRPGVNQQVFAGPMTFVDGPGGKPLGSAPRSVRCEVSKGGACVVDDDDHGGRERSAGRD
jgi:uncharacterized tannase-like protein DUF6351